MAIRQQIEQMLASDRLHEAQALATSALRSQPDDLDTLRLNAKVAMLLGDANGAEQTLRRALALSPTDPASHASLGDVLTLMSRTSEAEAAYNESLKLDPSHREVRINLAYLKIQQGLADAALEVLTPFTLVPRTRRDTDVDLVVSRAFEAAGLFTEAVQWLHPESGDMPVVVLEQLARLYQRLGKPEEEIAVVEAIYRRQASAETGARLGTLLLQAKRYQEAVEVYEQDPDTFASDPAAQNNLGLAYQSLDRHEDAIDCYVVAIHQNPVDIAPRHNLIWLLHSTGRFDEAETEADALLGMEQGRFDGALWRARVAHSRGDYDNAQSRYLDALTLDPASHAVRNNLALVCREQGRFAEARQLLQSLLDEDPEYAAARCNLGLVIRDLGDIDGAMREFDIVLDADPENEEALWNSSVTRLYAGDFRHGWGDYEKRWRRKESLKRDLPVPYWQGTEPLAGKSILVWAEQGLGDEIMFASCLPDLIREGAEVWLDCEPRLKRLFARSFPDLTVRGGKTGASLAKLCGEKSFDFQTGIASLPRTYRAGLAWFPRSGAYLQADDILRSQWRQRLASLPGHLKVGISWRGGMVSSRRALRSQNLADWAPFLSLPGVDFVSLQYTPCADELEQLDVSRGLTVHHWPEAISDYDQTAALVSELDLVISVCTSVIHLSGALGKEAWVLTPCSPEWRYGMTGDQMPWYTSVKLIRQSTPLEWAPVVDTVRQRLIAAMSSKISAG